MYIQIVKSQIFLRKNERYVYKKQDISLLFRLILTLIATIVQIITAISCPPDPPKCVVRPVPAHSGSLGILLQLKGGIRPGSHYHENPGNLFDIRTHANRVELNRAVTGHPVHRDGGSLAFQAESKYL